MVSASETVRLSWNSLPSRRSVVATVRSSLDVGEWKITGADRAGLDAAWSWRTRRRSATSTGIGMGNSRHAAENPERQMYGRASFKLLRKRVLLAS